MRSLMLCIYWHLLVAVSGPFVLLQRGRWACAAFRGMLLLTPVLGFKAYHTMRFWVFVGTMVAAWLLVRLVLRAYAGLRLSFSRAFALASAGGSTTQQCVRQGVLAVRWLNRHNLALVVSRQHLLSSSIKQLNEKDGRRLAYASLRIKYVSSTTVR
jgi:hypothetical protein